MCWRGRFAQGAAETVRPWQVVDLQWTAERELANPYVDGLPDSGAPYLKVLLQGVEADVQGKRYEVPGFWDGGQTWTVRIALPTSGEWSYSTESSDAGLHGHQGRIVCQPWTESQKQENPTRRGPLTVCRDGPRPGRYFQYADGTPCLWLGDTWWNWTKRNIRFESFQKLADDRAAKGFNVGQLFFAGNGWGRDASLLDRTYRAPDLEHIRRVEKMIAYANSKGITVWIHAWWGRADMKTQIGEENVRRWWRYVVHRLAAYNVIWVLAGEYNMDNYGGLGLAFWNDLGRMIKKEDPYDRAVSAHPTPPFWKGGADAPQWSTAEVLHQEKWLDYNQSQTGTGDGRTNSSPNRRGSLPTAAGQADRGDGALVRVRPRQSHGCGRPVRRLVGRAFGAAGHSYGGGHVWKAHLPESPAGRDVWPMEAGFEVNTLDYPGAGRWASWPGFCGASTGGFWSHIRNWCWKTPRTTAGPCRASSMWSTCDTAAWPRSTCRPSNERDSFEYQWLDLGEEKLKKSGTISGGAIRQFSAPEQFPDKPEAKDWVLCVRRK